MLRYLRLVLALALVPVVILASSGAAEAATVYGTPKTANVRLDHWMPGFDQKCAITAYYKLTDAGYETVKFKGQCKGVAANSPDYTLEFKGIKVEGGGQCALRGYTQGGNGMNMTNEFTGEALPFGLVAPLCQVSEICISGTTVADNWPDTNWDEECSDLPLGPLPNPATDPGSTCQYGTVTRPVVDRVHWSASHPQAQNHGAWNTQSVLTINQTAGLPDRSPSGAAGDWWHYLIIRDVTGGAHMVYGTENNANRTNAYTDDGNSTGAFLGIGWDPMAPGASASETSTISMVVSDWGSGNSPTPNREQGGMVLGAGVFLRSTDGQPYLWGATRSPRPDGMMGINDPGSCAWYWGADVLDGSGPEYAPTGPLPLNVAPDDEGPPEPPPDPEDPPGGNTVEPDPPMPGNDPEGGTENPPIEPPAACDFDISAPSTWLSGGMCAVVGVLMEVAKLLGKVFDAIVALAGQIGDLLGAIAALAGQLLDGLVGLLVPDAAVLEGEVSSVVDAWDDTSVAKYKDAFTGQNFAFTASGCGGVPVNFDLPGGVPVAMQFGEACSGSMATAATILKLVATAFLVIFGGLGCLRALGSGFGWSPGIGKGSDT